MKKLLAVTAVLCSFAAQADVLPGNFEIQSLDTRAKTNYTNLISRVEFNRPHELNIAQDDDIYFQAGRRVLEHELNLKESYCKLDTDANDMKDFTGAHVSKRGNMLSMKKGLIRAVESVNVSPDFKAKTIEYDINFIRSVVGKFNEVVDELECVVPISDGKDLTIADVMAITGNAFTFDYINIEQK